MEHGLTFDIVTDGLRSVVSDVIMLKCLGTRQRCSEGVKERQDCLPYQREFSSVLQQRS